MNRLGTNVSPGLINLTFFTADIQPITTVIVDTIAITSPGSAKWSITITDDVTNATQSCETFASFTLTNATHTVYGIVGDVLLYDIFVTVSGDSLLLQAKNNGGNVIIATVSRL